MKELVFSALQKLYLKFVSFNKQWPIENRIIYLEKLRKMGNTKRFNIGIIKYDMGVYIFFNSFAIVLTIFLCLQI